MKQQGATRLVIVALPNALLDDGLGRHGVIGASFSNSARTTSARASPFARNSLPTSPLAKTPHSALLSLERQPTPMDPPWARCAIRPQKGTSLVIPCHPTNADPLSRPL